PRRATLRPRRCCDEGEWGGPAAEHSGIRRICIYSAMRIRQLCEGVTAPGGGERLSVRRLGARIQVCDPLRYGMDGGPPTMPHASPQTRRERDPSSRSGASLRAPSMGRAGRAALALACAVALVAVAGCASTRAVQEPRPATTAPL